VQTPQGLPEPELDGWVGHTGYGMTLISSLYEVHFDEQAHLVHPTRTALAGLWSLPNGPEGLKKEVISANVEKS
jgi:hypothetical protein